MVSHTCILVITHAVIHKIIRHEFLFLKLYINDTQICFFQYKFRPIFRSINISQTNFGNNSDKSSGEILAFRINILEKRIISQTKSDISRKKNPSQIVPSKICLNMYVWFFSPNLSGTEFPKT